MYFISSFFVFTVLKLFKKCVLTIHSYYFSIFAFQKIVRKLWTKFLQVTTIHMKTNPWLFDVSEYISVKILCQKANDIGLLLLTSKYQDRRKSLIPKQTKSFWVLIFYKVWVYRNNSCLSGYFKSFIRLSIIQDEKARFC